MAALPSPVTILYVGFGLAAFAALGIWFSDREAYWTWWGK